jgi:hypothetical protein
VSDAIDKTAAGATRGLFGALGFILLMLGLEGMTIYKAEIGLGFGAVLAILGVLCFFAAALWGTLRKYITPEGERIIGNAAKNRWLWAGLVFIFLEVLIFSPFIEQHRIPFRSIAIEPSFGGVFDEFGSELGSPTGIARPAAIRPREPSAVVAFFDHGTAIWDRQRLAIYRLKSQSRWDVWPHTNEAIDPKWFDSDAVRKALHLPDGVSVPWGGFASEWAADPEAWKWLGDFQWSCILDGDKTFFQDFENGHLLGPLPVRKGSNDGQIVILFSNGAWESRRSLADAPCS